MRKRKTRSWRGKVKIGKKEKKNAIMAKTNWVKIKQMTYP